MKFLLMLFAVPLFFAGPSLGATDAERDSLPHRIPLVALLVDLEEYVGERVRVVGVLMIEKEADRLCLTREHAWGLTDPTSCVGLNLFPSKHSTEQDKEKRHRLRFWNGQYVTIDGRVESTGPLMLGGIHQIERAQLGGARTFQVIEWKIEEHNAAGN